MLPPSDEKAGGGGQPPNRVSLDAAAGALAGAVSRFVVGPLDVVKIRFQVQLEPIASGQAAAAASKYTGFGQALWTIFREEGVQARGAAVVRALLGRGAAALPPPPPPARRRRLQPACL